MLGPNLHEKHSQQSIQFFKMQPILKNHYEILGQFCVAASYRGYNEVKTLMYGLTNMTIVLDSCSSFRCEGTLRNP